MAGGRGVGNIDDHADGVVCLPRRAVAVRDSVAAVIHELVRCLVVVIHRTEADLVVRYLQRIGTDAWRRVGNGVDTELLGTRRRARGRGECVERVAAVFGWIANDLERVAATQVAADMYGHGRRGRTARGQNTQAAVARTDNHLEERIAARNRTK